MAHFYTAYQPDEIPLVGKSVMLDPKFITPTNVSDADIARCLNGDEVSEIK